MLGIGCSAIINIAMTLILLLHFVTIDKQTNSNDICFAQKSYATDINRNKDSTIFSLMYFFGIFCSFISIAIRNINLVYRSRKMKIHS